MDVRQYRQRKFIFVSPNDFIFPFKFLNLNRPRWKTLQNYTVSYYSFVDILIVWKWIFLMSLKVKIRKNLKKLT